MQRVTIEKAQLKKDIPDIQPGDMIRVSQRLKEGDKSRISRFEGMVIAMKHGRGVNGTITVRKVVQEIGVERVFPIHSPTIERIEILRRPTRVRRAKLYFIRDKAARVIRKKMKMAHHRDLNVGRASGAEPEAKEDEDVVEPAVEASVE
jgi:large subunit ribosomal protein L19